MYVRNHYKYKNKLPKHFTKKRPLYLNNVRKPIKAMWPVKTLIAVSLLLTLILVVPTIVVIPFIKQQDPIQAVTEKLNNTSEENVDEEETITVAVNRTKTEETDQVPLETYVVRVVASEMPTDFELEALKAQGLAARTYIVNHLMYQEDENISDGELDQVYKDETELRELWGEKYYANMEKITEAVLATEGLIITYNDKPITAAYFSTSNGYTENSGEYWEHSLPYLKSVSSPWDEDSPKFLEQTIYTIEEVESLLDIDLQDKVEMKLLRTDSGRVAQVIFGNNEFTGREVREKLRLPSSDFSIKRNDEHFVFTTKGYGHGIGMSQYGANGMAQEGKTYEEIIHHYYTDVKIQSISDIGLDLFN